MPGHCGWFVLRRGRAGAEPWFSSVERRQRESEGGPARAVGVGPQFSAMGIDDGPADRQADAQAAGLRRVEGLEHALGRKADIERFPDQPGDVPQTWASVDKARRLLGYQPTTSYPEGVRKFAEWLRRD